MLSQLTGITKIHPSNQVFAAFSENYIFIWGATVSYSSTRRLLKYNINKKTFEDIISI